MVPVGDALLSDDVFDVGFACDLSACKGACCVEGETGAPLTDEEVGRIEALHPTIEPYLRPVSRDLIARRGAYERDLDGRPSTRLVNGRECVYVTFDARGVAQCAFQRAFRDGATEWPKPISCHLYPIRERWLPTGVALNVDRWSVCAPARSCGAARETSVLEFCRDALVRRFGEAWYAEALEAAKQR